MVAAAVAAVAVAVGAGLDPVVAGRLANCFVFLCQ